MDRDRGGGRTYKYKGDLWGGGRTYKGEGRSRWSSVGENKSLTCYEVCAVDMRLVLVVNMCCRGDIYAVHSAPKDDD